MKGFPRRFTDGVEDFVLPGVFNPFTGRQDLTAYIYGSRLIERIRRGLNSPEDGLLIKETLSAPASIFLAEDLDHLYFKPVRKGLVYGVRMRVSDQHVYVWNFEPADPKDPSTPLQKGSDRMMGRLF